MNVEEIKELMTLFIDSNTLSFIYQTKIQHPRKREEYPSRRFYALHLLQRQVQ